MEVTWKTESSKRIFKTINDLLPEEATILCMGFTGSRMFGWGGENYDIDVRCLFAYKDWWDTLHLARHNCDTNMEELEHGLNRIKGNYWTFYQDLSKPFYIHPDFDYETMFSFCTIKNAEFHKGTVKNQINQLNAFQNPRTALHAYRLTMTPLYFIKTGIIEMNTLKVNEEPEFQFKQLELLKDIYKSRISRSINWIRVKNDLDKMYLQLLDIYEESELEGYDKEKYLDWKHKTTKRFYGDIT